MNSTCTAPLPVSQRECSPRVHRSFRLRSSMQLLPAQQHADPWQAQEIAVDNHL
jgi:hypothetical protein